MEKFSELIMLICFCLAEIVMLFRCVRQKSLDLKFERITAITTGIGFLSGIIAKIVTDTADWILIFYVFGVYLSYAAVVFSSRKSKEDK